VSEKKRTGAPVSESLWAATASIPDFPPLQRDTQADVCIIGAGIAGISTAYSLIREGKSVVVLDDGPVAGGMTQVTSAHLSNELDQRYYELERFHGENGIRLAAESHTQAIRTIDENARRERIDCDFARIDGFLFPVPSDDEKTLDRELDSARRAGLQKVEKLPTSPLPHWTTGPCLRFHRSTRRQNPLQQPRRPRRTRGCRRSSRRWKSRPRRFTRRRHQ
jgi:choline dehydrogenase-like flavoprotein